MDKKAAKKATKKAAIAASGDIIETLKGLVKKAKTYKVQLSRNTADIMKRYQTLYQAVVS